MECFLNYNVTVQQMARAYQASKTQKSPSPLDSRVHQALKLMGALCMQCLMEALEISKSLEARDAVQSTVKLEFRPHWKFPLAHRHSSNFQSVVFRHYLGCLGRLQKFDRHRKVFYSLVSSSALVCRRAFLRCRYSVCESGPLTSMIHSFCAIWAQWANVLLRSLFRSSSQHQTTKEVSPTRPLESHSWVRSRQGRS